MTFDIFRIDPNVLRFIAHSLFTEDSEEQQLLLASADYIEALERLVFVLGSG